MERRHTSLGNMLTKSFVFFSALLLILMVCMDWYLISRYQMEKRQQEGNALKSAADSVHRDFLQVNYLMYDIYGNNEDFRTLSGNLTNLEQYSHSYDLNETLKMRLVLEDAFHGHFILCSKGQFNRYFVDQTVVDSDDVYELRVLIQDLIKESGQDRKWHFVVANGSKYALLPVKQGRVSLCFLYNLSRREQHLRESLPEGCELHFIDTEELLQNGENAWERALAEKLEAASEQFFQRYGGRYISAYRIGNTSMWMCMSVRVNLLFFMSPWQMVLLVITMLSVVGVIFLRRRLEEYMIVPLRRLVQTMELIRDGHWEAKLESTDYVEIQRVNDALTAMVEEIQKQKILSYEHMLEKQQTQMRFLQLQLKPHFYLNGLKTLNAMVMEEDWRATQDVIISLSEHMRYLLQSERERVPLAAEVDFVKNYTQLQAKMTGRQFEIFWNIRKPSRDWQVPVLCIQTFLENSFKYAKMGSAQKELQLRIAIRELETEDGAYLDISVRDNGRGYPEEILDSINDDPEREGAGVGIKNLQRRCQLLYDGEAQYNFYNDNGAVSELSLPWKEENREHSDCG